MSHKESNLIEEVYSSPDIDESVIEFENEVNRTLKEISEKVPFEKRLEQLIAWKKY